MTIWAIFPVFRCAALSGAAVDRQKSQNRYVADFFQKSRLGTAGSGTKPIEPTIKNVFLDNLINICKAKINLTIPQTP